MDRRGLRRADRADAQRLAAGSADAAIGRSSRDYHRVFFASAYDCQPDTQGRIVIPPPLRAYAGLSRECVVIGADTRLEIWDAEAWADYLDAAESAYSASGSEAAAD